MLVERGDDEQRESDIDGPRHLHVRLRHEGGQAMPFRFLIDRGFTIAPNQTQFWNWNWFSDAGQDGPNKGPVTSGPCRRAPRKEATTRRGTSS
jgi:hypothetical protein